MKTLLAAACYFLVLSTYAQTAQAPAGDWVRVNARYSDGRSLPYNHPGRMLQRFRFEKQETWVFLGNTMNILPTTFSNNTLTLGPLQTFSVETSTQKEIILQEIKNPVRYYFIPTDSFTISGIVKYASAVSETDTVYTSNLGIEPIFQGGNSGFLRFIMERFSSATASFEFTFVVQKDGTIGDVTVEFSTNEKLNKRLIQIVKKSAGKWIPGAIGGKPVNVRERSKIGLSSGRG